MRLAHLFHNAKRWGLTIWLSVPICFVGNELLFCATSATTLLVVLVVVGFGVVAFFVHLFVLFCVAARSLGAAFLVFHKS